jgi:hypothetical protein
MEAQFLEAICLASVEILGEKETFQTLKGLGMSSFSALDPSLFTMERYGQELAKRHDEQVAAGLLIRIGRASLIFLRRYYETIGLLGAIDNRLKPIEKRFPDSLKVLAGEIGGEMGTKVETAAENALTYRWRLDAPERVFEPYYHFGLLEEFCNWLDSRKDYQIVYALQGAQGKAAELTIHVREKE